MQTFSFTPMTVTVVRTSRDAFGDPAGETTHPVDGCALVRHNTSEDRDTGEQVTETATLAAPAGVDVLASDDLTLPDGTRWHVDGRPHVPHNPLTGWEPVTSIPLRRVTG